MKWPAQPLFSYNCFYLRVPFGTLFTVLDAPDASKPFALQKVLRIRSFLLAWKAKSLLSSEILLAITLTVFISFPDQCFRLQPSLQVEIGWSKVRQEKDLIQKSMNKRKDLV
jgi:hypothetical protein